MLTLPLGVGVGVPPRAGVPASLGGVPGLGLEPVKVLCCDAAVSPARLEPEGIGVCAETVARNPKIEKEIRARGRRARRSVSIQKVPSRHCVALMEHESHYLVRNCAAQAHNHVRQDMDRAVSEAH